MREILTIIAACLLGVLTAALAVPPFVDWDARRGQIEAALAPQLGGKVELAAPITVRLLPAPRLTAGGFSIERQGLVTRAQAARFELSATALLQGRFDFNEASLDRADIAIDPAATPSAAPLREKITVQRFALTDATLRLAGANQPALEHIDLTGALDSLAGPYRGSGVQRGARKIAFTFSTGAIEAGRLRGKLALDDAAASGHADIDGELAVEKGAPVFTGRVVATGAAKDAPPWRAAFDLRATPAGAHAENIDARLGDEDHALGVAGAADYAPDGALSAKLTARNLDLDRFRSAYGLNAPPASAATSPITLELSADTATLGGETLTAPSLSLRAAPGERLQTKIAAGLPGRTQFSYQGAFVPPPALALSGDMRIETRDGRTLSAWLAPVAPDLARLVAALPFSHVNAPLRLELADGGLDARLSDAQFDRSRLSGLVSWRPATTSARASLNAQLESPTFDIDGLPELGAVGLVDPGVDLAVSFDAQAPKIARVGASSAAAGRIRLRFARDESGLSIDEIAVADVGGANLSGRGRFTPRGGGFDLRLDADKLGDLATLLRRMAPSAATEALAARAQALSPAHLTLGLATSARATLAQLNLSGEAGGTAISAQLQPSRETAGQMEFFARAETADGTSLLRQLGFAVLPLKGAGRGLLEARGAGAVGGPMATQAALSATGVRLVFNGESEFALDHAAAGGRFFLSADDIAPAIQMLAIGAPDLLQRIPARVDGRILVGQGRFAIEGLSAEISGVRASGNVARENGRLKGALTLDALSAPFLASLVLGPPQPAPAGALWPSLRFAPTTLEAPPADIDLSVARLDLGGGGEAEARAKLSFDSGALAFSDLQMKFAGGAVTGAGALRREGGAAMASARLAFDNLEAARGPFAARASGQIEAFGAGASAVELVGSLAGQGRARLSDVRIDRASADFAARAVVTLDNAANPAGAGVVQQMIESAFDSGVQMLAPFETDLSISNGRLGFGPALVQAGAGAMARLNGGFDLRNGALDLRERLETQKPLGWPTPPTIELAWAGSPDAPMRRVQTDALVVALAERSVAREMARNEALEADVRERAFFNRRLKLDRAAEEARRAEAAEIARVEHERHAREREERAERDRIERERRAARQAAEGPAERRAVEPPRHEERKPPATAPRTPSAFDPAHGAAAPDPSTAGRY